MPPPTLRVKDFQPVNADRVIPIVFADRFGGVRGRDGRDQNLPNDPERTELLDAACWNFVLNAARNQRPAGLPDPSDIMNTMVEVSPYEEHEVGGTVAPNGRPADRIARPRTCHPERVVTTAPTAAGDAQGTELIVRERQQALRRAFDAAVRDGFPSHAVNSRNRQTGAPCALNIFDRTANQQEFHYLLVKTIVQLYGFKTMSRERAAIGHRTFSRQWMTIVVRSSTWWGWDHWAFKATRVTGFHNVTSAYAQTVPDVPAAVGCTTFWDEHYPETRVYLAEMPRNTRDMLEALQ